MTIAPVEQDDCAVAVIGAGIAGLSAAWALRRAGAPVIVLEAAGRVGGVISSERHGEYLIERGPTSAMCTPELEELITDLGLEGDRIGPEPEARKRFVVRDGAAIPVPMSPPAMLASPLLSATGKVRALAELFVPRASANAPEESVGALARRRFGREAADYLIDPMISGIYAGDPDRLSSRHTVQMMHDWEQRSGSVLKGAIAAGRAKRRASRAGAKNVARAMFSFREGLCELPEAIASSLGDSVKLSTRAIAIEHDGDSWQLVCESPAGVERIAIRSVISTVPAHALAAIAMPAPLRERIERVVEITDVPVTTLALGFRRSDVAHPLDGFGALMPHAERMGILGALFNSSIFASRAPSDAVLITCMIGGAREPAATHESEDALVRRTLAAIGPLLGITGAPIMVRATRWAHAIPQYEIGHASVVAAASEAEDSFPGLILAGSYRDGVSIGDRVRSGMRAGARAAAFAPIALEKRHLG